MAANAGGLSRRRKAGGDEPGSPSTMSTEPIAGSSSAGGSTVTTPTVASRSSNGHVVAYDKRDMGDSDEERSTPKLTIMEEVLLLGLKDRNDNISYALRGCIILELALRHRIAVVKDPNRRRYPLADRYIEVIDEKMTGEVILDEALKLIKMSEKMSIGNWVDLLSGETWNVLKIGYQLKQVRERLAKGLVDKGALRTEKRSFVIFDMATHPVSDPTFKDDVLKRCLTLLTSRTHAVNIPVSQFFSSDVRYRTLRTVTMVCAAFSANVLENALTNANYDVREAAFVKCDELLASFSQWPFDARATGTRSGGLAGGSRSPTVDPTSNMAEIGRLIRQEVAEGNELCIEIVAAVLHVFSRMDSLL